MFLHMSVILSTGEAVPGQVPPRQVHPRAGTLPGQVHPLGRYTPRAGTPPWTGTPLPREQCMLGDTANKRAVRILLECILV